MMSENIARRETRGLVGTLEFFQQGQITINLL